MKRLFVAFCIVIVFGCSGSALLYAQQYKVTMQMSFWADTTIWNDLSPIIEVYKRYLESRPDSVYDNPYWNEKEKQQYTDFDFSRNSLYPNRTDLNAQYVFSKWKVVLLNVELKDSVYLLQSMFWSDSFAVQKPAINPLMMNRYYVIKEGGKWKMANALPYDTKHWMVKDGKFIRYHYQVPEYYSDSLAAVNDEFCSYLMERFHTAPPPKIELYAVNGKHEVGKLLGYDYYFQGYAEAKSIQNIIISGNKSIYYPHEIAHQFFPKPAGRGTLVDEGLATWLGGSIGKSFKQLAKNYANDYRKIQGMTFSSASLCEVLNCYPLGAIVLDMVQKEAGDPGVIQFINLRSVTLPELYSAIYQVTGWDEKLFNQKFEEYITQLDQLN